MKRSARTITLAGHPYAPIGRGEDVRCTFRALRSVAAQPALFDIYGLVSPDAEAAREFGPYLIDKLGLLNIFHINGDEVERALNHLKRHRAGDSYDIVYPNWELASYPGEWARQLDRFDEIWAPSKFVQECLAASCTKPVILMPLATEVILTHFLGRRYFGITESDYVFLFFFDLRSYISRKNPGAVIEAFRRLIANRPSAHARLVIKVGGGDHNPAALEALRVELSDLHDRVQLMTRPMTDNEVKNLVRSCDCFISLHRSEGYGRGLAEAMFLGKPVIATAYSGNMDFVSSDIALLVPYDLVPVADGAYPHWQDQVWANPDVEHASKYMIKLIDDPAHGHEIGARASHHIRVHFGYRSCGIRYLRRIEDIRDHRSVDTLKATAAVAH